MSAETFAKSDKGRNQTKKNPNAAQTWKPNLTFMNTAEASNIKSYNNLPIFLQATEFDQAFKIISWNRRLLSTMGIWPLKVSRPRLIFFCGYMIIHCTMGVGHLIKYFSQPEYIVANLADNVLFVMIIGKMLICDRSRGIMVEFLNDIQPDFSVKNYSSAREKTLYLRYNEFALLFIKVSIGMASFTATLYYIRGFLESWSKIPSSNASYELPYRTYPFFDIQDMTTYFCICAYQIIAVPVVVCGYSAPDSFVLSMALHVCGQLAVLSCRIEDLLKDHVNYNRHIRTIVIRHRQLITIPVLWAFYNKRLAEILESNYNMIFLQQTLGTVFLLCLTTYHMLANSEHGDNTNMVSFLFYTCCVVSTILAYCYIGECLITESVRLRDTFYNTDWYNNPPSCAKMLSFCMTRSEKPLVLTAGKFCILSLNTFTSIVKTSMAYLSMLRQFM